MSNLKSMITDQTSCLLAFLINVAKHLFGSFRLEGPLRSEHSLLPIVISVNSTKPGLCFYLSTYFIRFSKRKLFF